MTDPQGTPDRKHRTGSFGTFPVLFLVWLISLPARRSPASAGRRGHRPAAWSLCFSLRRCVFCGLFVGVSLSRRADRLVRKLSFGETIFQKGIDSYAA